MFGPAASRLGACAPLSETGVVGGRQHKIESKDLELLTAHAQLHVFTCMALYCTAVKASAGLDTAWETAL